MWQYKSSLIHNLTIILHGLVGNTCNILLSVAFWCCSDVSGPLKVIGNGTVWNRTSGTTSTGSMFILCHFQDTITMALFCTNYKIRQDLVPGSSRVKDALGDKIPQAPPVLFNLVPADAHFPEIFLSWRYLSSSVVIDLASSWNPWVPIWELVVEV